MRAGRSPRVVCNVHLIAAARPNFMKIAPLYHALAAESWVSAKIVHTGQHYDTNMSDAFFRDLQLPEPHFHLEVGSGSHAEQTAGVMVAYEKVCTRERPDWTIVVGDVNSTAACAMVAAKLWIPVVHLEAGLRSGDRRMPEEINRLVTDSVSDVLWTPSPDGDENLLREGVSPERIDRVGNIMIDSYEMLRPQIEADRGPEKFGLKRGGYAVVTLHRPSNVDRRDTLGYLTAQLLSIAARLPLVFAVHPRTRKKLEEFGLWTKLQSSPDLRLTEPLGYVEFMALVSSARAAITDSGGIQEESTYLGIPCLTVRENTERPITVRQGRNRLVSPQLLAASIDAVLEDRWPRGSRPDGWDGRTAARCVEALKRRDAARRSNNTARESLAP
jgi:UDP-N-acetylglucosamine 2-epimerase (non-hydrolysing)